MFADIKILPYFLQLVVETVPSKDSKCIHIRQFTVEGKEFNNVNQLRNAVELLGLAYDHIISKGEESFVRDLMGPWVRKLSKFDDCNFCDLEVGFLEKEFNGTLGNMAFALRGNNIDEKDRQVVKTMLVDAMAFDDADIFRRGLIATMAKPTNKVNPPPPPKGGKGSGSRQQFQGGGFGNNSSSSGFQGYHSNNNNNRQQGYGNGNHQQGYGSQGNYHQQSCGAQGNSAGYSNRQRSSDTSDQSQKPCLSQMMHKYLQQPVCSRQHCPFDHNIDRLDKEKLLKAASNATGPFATQLMTKLDPKKG